MVPQFWSDCTSETDECCLSVGRTRWTGACETVVLLCGTTATSSKLFLRRPLVSVLPRSFIVGRASVLRPTDPVVRLGRQTYGPASAPIVPSVLDIVRATRFRIERLKRITRSGSLRPTEPPHLFLDKHFKRRHVGSADLRSVGLGRHLVVGLVKYPVLGTQPTDTASSGVEPKQLRRVRSVGCVGARLPPPGSTAAFRST